MSPPAVLGELVDRFDDHREVIHEAAIKVSGRTKAPDYCFRVGGGKASFFLEAKKPSLDMREAIHLGKLDEFVANKKVKKGTAEVDTAFLDEIESWHDLFARNIALPGARRPNWRRLHRVMTIGQRQSAHGRIEIWVSDSSRGGPGRRVEGMAETCQSRARKLRHCISRRRGKTMLHNTVRPVTFAILRVGKHRNHPN